MSRGQFNGKITFKIEGVTTDVNDSHDRQAAYELSADIIAQHGMSEHDLLSGWVIRSINGQEVLLASYHDGLLFSLVQLIAKATDRRERMSIPLERMMRNRHEPQEGQASRTEGSPGNLRRTARGELSRALPKELPPNVRSRGGH